MARRSQHQSFNPFRGFLDVMSEMNRMQHQWMLKDTPAKIGNRTHASAWVPHTDIFARDGDLIIRCELAGMKPDEVDVTVSSGVLTISGERRSDLNEANLTFYTRERVYGAFRRSMILPEGVSQNDIVANMHHGMLEVTVKGAAAAKLHHIGIESGED